MKIKIADKLTKEDYGDIVEYLSRIKRILEFNGSSTRRISKITGKICLKLALEEMEQRPPDFNLPIKYKNGK